MPGVGRLGDKISCGSIVAEGSGNVFANGMPVSHAGKRKATEHADWVPTALIGPWAKTVFVNGQPVALSGITKIKPHKKKNNKKKHEGVLAGGSQTVVAEG